MEIVLEENEYLKKQLCLAMCKVTPADKVNVPSLLSLLLEYAKKNSGRSSEGWRYEKVIKELGFLMFSLGGLALYEILSCHDNFPLPSVSTVRRMIYSKEAFQKGSLRAKELTKFLDCNNLPPVVFLCEDATRVTGRIQYHAASNQSVGFTLPLDSHGLPKVGYFLATSAPKIAEYLSKFLTSCNAYCVLAVPMKVGAPFCLTMYSTDI